MLVYVLSQKGVPAGKGISCSVLIRPYPPFIQPVVFKVSEPMQGKSYKVVGVGSIKMKK